MTPDDLAHILRFLYGDKRGLGAGEAARDLAGRQDHLREMLAGKRPIPEAWQDYLIVRTHMRGTLDGWREAYKELVQAISAPTWARVAGLKNRLVHY